MSQHLPRRAAAAFTVVMSLLAGVSARPVSATSAFSAGGPPSATRVAAAEAANAVPHDSRPFTPGTSLARTQTAQTSTATSTSTPRPQVFGYVNAGNLGNSNDGYSSWRFQDLTTVAFFGLHVNSDGTLANDGGMTVWNSQDLTNLINAAHPYGVKVVVSIIQQSQSTLCSSLANAQTTVTQVINQINAKGVDGVNIDYEGSQATCSSTASDTLASRLDNLAKLFRQQLPADRNNLTIATYASSAYYTGGFFDIPTLAAYVNQFFVMAYDLDNSNWSQAPLNCSKYCFSPVGPLSAYAWTDERAVSTYKAVVSASQVILGVPYYGWYACVSSPVSNAYPTDCPGYTAPQWVNPTYLSSLSIPSTSGVSQYSSHTDAHDSSEHYATWWSSSYNSWREMYIDDPSSLGAKYDLVTSSGIAGAGLFSLDYGGGDAGLWGAIEYHLTCPVSVSVPSNVTSTRFQVTMVPAPACAQSLDLEEYDQTLNQGWFDLVLGGASSVTTITIDSYPGHTYAFRARAHDVYGRVDAWTPILPTVAVPATATDAHPFAGLYSLDGYGGVHGVDSAPLQISDYWQGWNIARALAQLPGGQPGGYVLDGWGGLHPYGGALGAKTSAYWAGWDIARAVQVLPNGTGGYVLDGWGGLHPFAIGGNAMPPDAHTSAYWGGWDIARGFVILPDSSGGYVLDGWGGLHPFAIGSNPMPASPKTSAYWGGWDIARAVALVPGTNTGYVLDGWGGVHPFNNAPQASTSAYWGGWDIARSIWVTVIGGQAEGYVLDGWGGVHPFNGIAAPSSYTYWPGWDIARGLSGS